MHSFWRTAVILSFLFMWSGFGSRSIQAETTDCSKLPEGFQFRTIEDASGQHRFAVFTPRQYDPSRKWPVALFLHGAGEKGNDGALPLYGMLATALEKWPDLPFIAVFPQCEDLTSRALTGWLADSSDGERAMKILDAVEHEFSVDPQRRMLLGWSMGGYGAWSLAAAHPEKWSSVLVLAGGALHDELPLAGLAQDKTPVWAISAKGDPLIPFQRSEKLIEQLNQLGGRGKFTLLNSIEHDVCQRAFASPQTFQWLLHPDSIDPAAIDLEHVTPLPARSNFYGACLVESEVIPNAFAMRLGNAPFKQLAPELPELLSSAPIAGKLADIERSVGSGSNQIKVRLMDVSYHCKITRIWMHAISGGRLGLDVDFEPLELTIGKTSLDSVRNKASTGQIQILIGVHKPATLKLEVQPVMEAGQLRLRLLRRNFSFAQGNWYISPPQQVEAHSDQFTPDQLVTGIIGSLYGGRADLVDRILDVVPELIKRTEVELRARDAPGLAKVLSPLPVLVPELKVSASQVSTDARGVSVICDLNVSMRGKAGSVQSRHQLQLAQISRGDLLSAEVALDAITAISQLNIEQDFAQINVLDISEDKFAHLADPHFMNAILPRLNAPSGTQLSTILRLLDPMVVSRSPQTAAPRTTELVLQSSSVAIDVFRRETARSAPIPAGRIVFSLSQPITIETPADRDAPDAALQVSWSPDCKVEFLRGESLNGSPVPEVQAEQFEKTFADAWSTWGQAHAQQEIPLAVRRLGTTWLKLGELQVSDRELKLLFETAIENKN